MIPKQNDVNKRWYAPQESVMNFAKQEGDEVRALLGGYFESIALGLEKGNWNDANKAVEKLHAYQEQYGSSIMPNAGRIKSRNLF